MNHQIRNILVAFSGSKASKKALEKSLSITENLAIHLYVLLVVEPNSLLNELLAYNNILDAAASKIIYELAVIVDKIIEADDSKTVHPQINVLIGKPSQVIVDFSQNKKIDLVIMGITENHYEEDNLQDSVTSYVVEHVQSDVLVIK